MNKLAIILLFTTHLLSFAQTKDTTTVSYVAVQSYEIDFSTIEKVEKPKISDYQGNYHFGESEGESQLEIIYSNGKLFARSVYYEWEKENWVLKQVREQLLFENGKVKINEILFELYKCLKATNSILDKGDKGLVSHYYEKTDSKIHHFIQINSDGPIEVPKGKYPESSFVKLTSNDLSNLSKNDLKIMRNEIYARKGYQFKPGGKMDNYFSSKDWYKTLKKMTEINLSKIEKYNVDFIKILE